MKCLDLIDFSVYSDSSSVQIQLCTIPTNFKNPINVQKWCYSTILAAKNTFKLRS